MIMNIFKSKAIVIPVVSTYLHNCFVQWQLIFVLSADSSGFIVYESTDVVNHSDSDSSYYYSDEERSFSGMIRAIEILQKLDNARIEKMKNKTVTMQRLRTTGQREFRIRSFPRITVIIVIILLNSVKMKLNLNMKNRMPKIIFLNCNLYFL